MNRGPFSARKGRWSRVVFLAPPSCDPGDAIFFSGARSSLMKGDAQLSRSIMIHMIDVLMYMSYSHGRGISRTSRRIGAWKNVELLKNGQQMIEDLHSFTFSMLANGHRPSMPIEWVNASKRIHSTPILTVWLIVKHIKPPGPEFNINLNINIIQANHEACQIIQAISELQNPGIARASLGKLLLDLQPSMPHAFRLRGAHWPGVRISTVHQLFQALCYILRSGVLWVARFEEEHLGREVSNWCFQMLPADPTWDYNYIINQEDATRQ